MQVLLNEIQASAFRCHIVSSFCLQLIMSYMACLENYVGHMMQLSLTDELSIGHMHSLPSAVFQTIKATFKHCKVLFGT